VLFCRESCEALTDIFCADVWSVLSGDGPGVLPTCEMLPSTLNVSATPACFLVDLFAVTPEKISGLKISFVPVILDFMSPLSFSASMICSQFNRRVSTSGGHLYKHFVPQFAVGVVYENIIFLAQLELLSPGTTCSHAALLLLVPLFQKQFG